MFTHVLDRHMLQIPKRGKSWQRPECITTEILEAILNLDNFIKRERDWQSIKYKDS